MLYAKNEVGKKLMAAPRLRAFCPGCSEPVSARCGEVNIWHWAHDTSSLCPYAVETEWHLNWKSQFPPECVEIIDGPHRADVIFEGDVYEFQSVALDPSVMMERQAYWEGKGYRFFWVFEFMERYKNLSLRVKAGYVSFRWKWPMRRLECLPFPYYLDLGNALLLVKKVYWDSFKVGGYGSILDIDYLCRPMATGTQKTQK